MNIEANLRLARACLTWLGHSASPLITQAKHEVTEGFYGDNTDFFDSDELVDIVICLNA